MLEKVKTALRITHNKLDRDILDTIAVAKAEMARAGLTQITIAEDDVLIADAIKTFCKYSYSTDETTRDGYFLSWQYQLDCLRKTKVYSEEVVEDV